MKTSSAAKAERPVSVPKAAVVVGDWADIGFGWRSESTTDRRRLRSMTDGEVDVAITDDPGAKPTDKALWKDARVKRALEPSFGRI